MQDPSSDVLNALRLGWTVSELLGRIRKGARPPRRRYRGPNYVPRITAGEGTIESSSAALVFAALRLLALSDALSVKCEDDEALQQIVEGLPRSLERWLAGRRSAFYTPAQLRQILENWSLRIWSQLNARSEAAALAFTLGISLADTYWYLRKPAQRPRRCPPKEDWRELLSVYRLAVERDRLETLRPYLPAYLVTTLRSHLNHWSIGTELERDAQGNLRRVPFLVRTSHPLGWRISPDRWDRAGWFFRVTHPLGFIPFFRRPNRSPNLTDEEEIALQEALERQAEIWSSLIFGLRQPATYLFRRDWFWIRIITWTGVAMAVAGVILVALWGVARLGPALVNVAQPAFDRIAPGVTRFLRQPGGGVREWVALAIQVIPVVAGLGAAVVGLYRWAARLYRGWNERVTGWFIVRRRTLVPWDRRLRSL